MKPDPNAQVIDLSAARSARMPAQTKAERDLAALNELLGELMTGVAELCRENRQLQRKLARLSSRKAKGGRNA